MDVSLIIVQAGLLNIDQGIMRIETIEQLQRLHEMIGEALAGQNVTITVDKYIDTVQMIEIAQSYSLELSGTTLRSAMDRGNIKRAHKDGGRWVAPEAEYRQWLEKFAQKKGQARRYAVG